MDEARGIDLSRYDNIYITDNYAIENDIVSFATFERMLRTKYHIQLTPQERSLLEGRFMAARQKTCEISETVMCWYAVAKKKDKAASYDCVRLKDFIKIDECNAVAQVDDLATSVAGIWGLDAEHEAGLFENERKTFRRVSERYECVRGKFLTWFFLAFTKSFLQDCRKIIPRLEGKRGGSNIGEAHFVDETAHYSTAPDSLKTFTQRTFLSFIEEHEGA